MDILLGVLEKIERTLATISGLTVGTMMFLVTLDVGSRFILGPSVPGVFEAVELLMVPVVFFAIPYCESERSHIRMAFFIDRLNPGGRRLAEMLACTCGIAICSLIFWGASKYTFESFIGHYKAGPLAPIPIWPFVASISLG
ncbi:hypothetical protein LCGC14_2816640, partial [marine sediment metagenome]